jgi:hypothetical protein
MRLRQEDPEFEARLGYIVRPCHKKQTKPKQLLEENISIMFITLNLAMDSEI